MPRDNIVCIWRMFVFMSVVEVFSQLTIIITTVTVCGYVGRFVV